MLTKLMVTAAIIIPPIRPYQPLYKNTTNSTDAPYSSIVLQILIMEKNKVKSGKEILDDFFKEISIIENVDEIISKSLTKLYSEGKFTDKNVVNELLNIRKQNDNKD